MIWHDMTLLNKDAIKKSQKSLPTFNIDDKYFLLIQSFFNRNLNSATEPIHCYINMNIQFWRGFLDFSFHIAYIQRRTWSRIGNETD